MRTLKRNGITWFLEDEALHALVERIAIPTQSRRTHHYLDLGERQVFAKHFVENGLGGFFRNRILPRARKEYYLGKRLASLRVATPSPLGYGIGRAGSFILQERIDAVSFKSALESGPDREALLDGLALLLKQLRAQRIKHNDLHLENVMVRGGQLYLIDLHKTVIRRRNRFSRADELLNLTHALTMIYDRMTEIEKSRFFLLYGRPEIRASVEEGLLLLWREWIASKKKRAFSTTSKLVAVGHRVCVRDNLGRGDGPFRAFMKKDKKVTVEKHDDHVRKIYRDRRRLIRAWISHVTLEYLETQAGPRPFYIQKASLFHRGYVAMEDLSGKGIELDRFLDGEYERMDAGRRRRFGDTLAHFLRDLLTKGILHKDVKACNLFVLPEGFRLLDIEDVHFRRPDKDDLEKMFVQLNTSVPRKIADRERLRFFASVMRGFRIDRKGLLRDVKQASSEREIVYEGVRGLMRESWQDRRQD